jgi:hypothetical protein
MCSDVERVGVEKVGAGWVGTYTHYRGEHIAVVTAETPDPESAREAAIRFVQAPSDGTFGWGTHPIHRGRCAVFRTTGRGDEIVESRSDSKTP